MVALSVDVGYMANTKTQLQAVVNAGALAGAGALENGPTEAVTEVHRFISRNLVAGRALEAPEVLVELGEWDRETRTFTPGGTQPSAVRVVGTRRGAPLSFARVLGYETFEQTCEAIAAYRPRDIVLVSD
jgi:hypothetical protein